MYRTHFYPLRSVSGNAVEIEGIYVTPNRHDYLDFIDRMHPSQGAAVINEFYQWFLPSIISDSVTYTPGTGMDTMPVASPNFCPFPATMPVASLFAVPKKGKEVGSWPIPGGGSSSNPGGMSGMRNKSKDYSVTLIIKLKQEALIGGICFAGFPYASCQLTNKPDGSTRANNTLPREIRLTPLPRIGQAATPRGFRSHEYMDSEFAYSRQEIISHSGYNYLCIDPVKTNLFALTLADFPEIITSVNFDASADEYQGTLPELKGFYGYAIPYFYLFGYAEKTKTAARLHSGILGIKTAIPEQEDDDEAVNADLIRVFPEYEFYRETGATTGFYLTFSAHSMLGQKRIFPVSGQSKRKQFKECFVSDMLEPGEKITIYLQQGEEYERCVAGLKALFLALPDDTKTEKMVDKLISLFTGSQPDGSLSLDERALVEDYIAFFARLPVETDFCEKIGIRIFEIDPTEGVSPAAVDTSSKYATLLADIIIDNGIELLFTRFLEGIRFRRTSTSKYFAIELSNAGDAPGQVCIHSLHLVRSAHVSLQPRAAKVQQVKALHYRLIGSELGEDFSKLGNEGFNFSIDRMVAGQTKNVLYSAMSLLDLLHTGGARIQSNMRRRAVEEETSTIIGNRGDNFEKRRLRADGWRSNETGFGVQKKISWNDEYSLPGEFKQISNNETRTHSKILAPQENDNNWKSTAFIGNALNSFFEAGSSRRRELEDLFTDREISPFLGEDQSLIPTSTEIKLFKDFESVWQGLVTPTGAGSPYHKDKLKISGMKSVTTSPFGINRLSKELFDFLDSLRTMNLDTVVQGIDFGTLLGTTLLTQGKVFALSAANSLSVGIQVQPFGLGLSFSASTSGGLLLPSYTYVNNFGNQGVIMLQAAKAGYNYFQSLNKSFDETTSFIDEGINNRRIERSESASHPNDRVKGAEVMWQGEVQDIITGSVPLNFALPATASKMHLRSADDSLRVRFNSGFTPSVQVDFWFELTEEIIQDDY